MAGEIQLNSTTMATESSGSITAQLDTIRPNTTNGSLTLQGDSSDSGVTGLTIDSSGNATFAQTIAGGTIGSSVVFPSGHLLKAHFQALTTNKTLVGDTVSLAITDLNSNFVDFGGDGTFTYSKLSSTSKLILHSNLHVWVYQSGAANKWVTVHQRILIGTDIVSTTVGAATGLNSYGVSYNSVDTTNNGKMSGYLPLHGEKTGLSSGNLTVKIQVVCGGNNTNMDAEICTYSPGQIIVYEIED